VRFTTAAELVTEMIEAQSQLQLTRVRNRWMRYELVFLTSLATSSCRTPRGVALPGDRRRAEQAAIIVTTNLPFSEWPAKIPTRGCARRCWIA